MSWYCKKCETNNEDTDDICLVCNSIPPVWDSVNCKIDSTGTTFRLSWRVNNANKVTILYGGAHFDVSRVYSYDLKINEERQVVFEAENDVATRVFTYTLTGSQSLEVEKHREQERIAEQKRQDGLAWAVACRWDAEDSYTTYLRNYPNGIHCIEAKNRIEKLKEERKEADEQLRKRKHSNNANASINSKRIKNRSLIVIQNFLFGFFGGIWPFVVVYLLLDNYIHNMATFCIVVFSPVIILAILFAIYWAHSDR